MERDTKYFIATITTFSVLSLAVLFYIISHIYQPKIRIQIEQEAKNQKTDSMNKDFLQRL